MRILVVEDNLRTAALIKEGLTSNHFAVDVCNDFESGLAASVDPDYDLILIDRRLPGGKDGIEICNNMRNTNISTPVIMLTAHAEINDRVHGLKMGADDYIAKPFSMKELVARIQAITRRPKEYKNTVYKIGDLTVDADKHEAYYNDLQLSLTPKEFGILLILIQNPSRSVTKQYIVSHVWDGDADILLNSIETYVSNLRKKISEASKSKINPIQTVWGVGYRLKYEHDV